MNAPTVQLEYPLDYVFKAIGLAGDDFEAHARRLVEEALGAEALSVTVRESSGGKYHAVSITVRLESEAQRRAVYQALWDDPRVVHHL